MNYKIKILNHMTYKRNLIIDRDYINYIKTTFHKDIILGGSRALMHLGFNLKRPLGDYDFIAPKVTHYQKIFLLIKPDHYFHHFKQIDQISHYYYNNDTCIFVNPKIQTVEFKGIKCAHPDSILKYKLEYTKYDLSGKHQQDLQNLSSVLWAFNNL